MASDFDGINDILTYGTTDLVGSGNDWSAACWVYPGTLGNMTFVAKRDAYSTSSTNGNNFDFGISGTRLFAATNATIRRDFGLTLTAGVWQFAGVRNSTNCTGYVDTSSLNLGTGLATGADTGAVIGIGGLSVENGEYLDGTLAEVAVWSGDIGDAAMLAMANGVSPLSFLNGLVFYCSLIRGQDDRYGLTATATGTTIVEHPPIFYPPPPQIAAFEAAVVGGRLMGSLIGPGGLVGPGGLIGSHGGLAA